MKRSSSPMPSIFTREVVPGKGRLPMRTIAAPLGYLTTSGKVCRSNNRSLFRTRIQYQAPWHRGLAVGSGSVEGACKHVIQSRFKRAGMR